MTEPVEALRTLADVPPSPPEAVDALYQRAAVRRRRRTRWRAGLGVVAAVVVAVAVVPLLDRPSDDRTSVVAGPGPSSTSLAPAAPTTSTTVPLEFVPGQPISTRIDYQVPPGWQTLFAQGDHVVLATRPLSDADRTLALLARDDSAFTSSFPPDAVVVVAGNDPTEAKYLLRADGSAVGPGPSYDLGPEKALPGGVRVRRGDVPQSGVKIAAYAGPSAPAARLAEAEAIARGMQLVRTGDPSVRPPPPPTGSRPGLPTGPLPVPEVGLPEVARTDASGSTLVLVAGQDCAYLRWIDAQTFLPAYQPLAGGCSPRPAGTGIEAFGAPVRVTLGPDSTAATAVILRAGPGVARYTARLADGRSVPVSMGTDGWGLVASDGRVVAVRGIDVQGRSIPETFVG